MSKLQRSFFDEGNRLALLSAMGDPLEILNRAIKWEDFRSVIEQKIRNPRTPKGGRPPFDVVLMFKILVLQRLYNLSDDQTEFLINDRMTFMRFLNLGLNDKVPDAKTIWKFRNDLATESVAGDLFKLFDQRLRAEGLITHRGSIVDATFVESPKQRNTPDENDHIKKGQTPPEWEKEDQKRKVAQKDQDARWGRKGDERHYGYKNHIKTDVDSKLITNYAVSDASVHDSQCCIPLLDSEDRVLYADSAYIGKDIASQLPPGCKARILEKGVKGAPLTKRQKYNNKRKSRIRCRVEHVFGFMTGTMKGITVRSIGIVRAEFNIGLTNLVYNMCRYRLLKERM